MASSALTRKFWRPLNQPMATTTGTVSSTNAHAFLPQYGGTAVASLVPAMTKASLTFPSGRLMKSQSEECQRTHRNENLDPIRNSNSQEASSAMSSLQKVKNLGQTAAGHAHSSSEADAEKAPGRGSDWW